MKCQIKNYNRIQLNKDKQHFNSDTQNQKTWLKNVILANLDENIFFSGMILFKGTNTDK